MQYKTIKKGTPGVVGGGEQKYYASPVYTGEIKLKQLGKRLSNGSTVTMTDAIAVLTGLEDLIAEQLKEGKIVRLGDIGSLRLSFNSNGEDTADKVTSRSIRATNVRFRPSKEFSQYLNDLQYTKVAESTSTAEASEDEAS